ncbi:MAG: ABC transporter substrate-binding protein [Janthinobacterium lividum]
MILEIRLLTSAAALSFALTVPALAQKADVVHYWTSGSESQALRVFADAFKQRGGTWIDSALGGFDDARAAAMNRVAGGNPPAALLDNIGEVKELAQRGILSPLEPEVADAVSQHMPPFLVKRITEAGKIYAIPVDIGGGNWMWYSTKAFADVGAKPPATWDEFFAVADKLKAKGYIPLALGGQPWQEASLFYDIMLSNGRDFYKNVLIDHNPAASGGALMIKSFETFRKLTAYVDEGSQGRNWNDATYLVVTNKAAVQIMGDWAKGEFTAAGLKPGQEFGCQLSPGTGDSYLMVVDLFDFPKVTDADQVKGQKLIESVLVDKDLQAKFNLVKGSLPPRLDADLSAADMCLKSGQKALSDPAAQVPNFEFVFTADQEGQIKDLVSRFWSTPSMTAEEAAKEFAAVVAQSQ